MLRKCGFLLVILLAVIFCGESARAQAILSKSEVNLSVMKDYQKFTSGNGIGQGATNGGGFQAGYRYHFSRLLAFELGYGRTRMSQVYDGGGLGRVQADTHQFTGAIVVTSPIALFGIRPYILGGGGGLFFDPTHNVPDYVAGASSQFDPAAMYGIGIQYGFFPHVAIRLGYRGFVLKAPDFGLKTLNTGAWTHMAQPEVGIVVRF